MSTFLLSYKPCIIMNPIHRIFVGIFAGGYTFFFFFLMFFIVVVEKQTPTHTQGRGLKAQTLKAHPQTPLNQVLLFFF